MQRLGLAAKIAMKAADSLCSAGTGWLGDISSHSAHSALLLQEKNEKNESWSGEGRERHESLE